ncbi:MAG: PAS domain S-box protein [Candidatus Kryptonium sp.]
MSLKVKFVLFSLFILVVLMVISNIFRYSVKIEPILIFTLIFFALGAGYIFIWRILNPIEKYKIAIERALKGQYIEIDYKSGDEVGELAEKLSKLIAKIKRRDLENFIISRVNHILLSNIQIQDAISEILKIFKESLGYYRFSIYLVDKENQKFRLLSSVGFQEKYLINELAFGSRGLINHAYIFRSPIYSPDVLNDPRYIKEHPDIRSEFDVPLMLGDEVIGILNVESDKIDGIKPEDREFLTRVSVQIATAFRNSEYYNQAMKRLRQLNILNKVSQMIGFKLDIEDILRSVLNLMMENYETNKIAIFLKNNREGTEVLNCAVSVGLSDRHIKIAEEYTPWRSEEYVSPIVIDDVENEKSLFNFRDVLVEERIKSLVFFPIVHREKFLGRLDIYFNSQKILGKEEIELGVNICGEIASAIENARLFELLKSSEKFIRTVLENAPVGILRVDNSGNLLYLNSEMKKVLGLSEDDVRSVVEERTKDFFNSINLDLLKKTLVRGEGIKKLFVPFSLDKGKEMTLVVDIQPVFASAGNIDGYIIIAMDVTEEEKLQRERLMLSKVIENLLEAVLITDISGNIQYVNPAFERITGYKINEVIGRNPRILKSGKHDKKFYENLWKTILSGKVWEGELINKKKNGDFYYEYMSISPLFDSQGNITNFVAIKRDISEQKLFEAQMLQFQKLESIGSISSGIAHDFNNVLSSIQAGIKVLRRKLTEEDPEIVKVLEILRKSVERGSDITRRLLNFVRRESGKFSTIDVNDLIQEIRTLVVHSFPENIKIETVIAENVGYVNVDYGQMVQAIMNLCINARDAMPNGGVLRIEAYSVDGESLKGKFAGVTSDQYVVISISDTGIGIPEEIKDKIFEPFFTTKPPEKGTGLGLPIVLKIIQSHNGFISYETQIGKGTTFYIYLPSVERKVEEAETIEIKEITPATILIVEDEDSLRYLLKEYLESRGHKVFATDDGYDAIEIYKMNMGKIDLVLIDIGLPTIDGITTFRKIKQINPNACVVLTSGYFITEPSPTVLMAEEGLSGFIQKPYDIDKIEFLIEKFIGKAKA